MTLSSTTFADAVSGTADAVKLASVSGILVGDLLVHGQEAMRVDAIVGLTARVSRGQAGTPAIAHASGATVYIAAAAALYSRDPVGVPPSPVLVTPWINLRTGDVWTVVAGAWVKADAAGSTSADVTQDAAVAANTAAIATLGGAADGLGSLRVARATFDATAGKAIAAYGLGVTIPDNAVVVGGFVQVGTTFTSATDAATIAISVEGANDVVSALAISNVANRWDAGKQSIVPKANTPESTGIALTAAREITATVAVEALTAGVCTVFLYYVAGL